MRASYKYSIYVILVWILVYTCYEYRLLMRNVGLERLLVSYNLADDLPKQRSGLDEFRTIHAEILNGHRPLKVIFNTIRGGGYANKMYCVLSTLLIGILSDRAVIMNLWTQLQPMIHEPLYKTYHVFNESNGLNLFYKESEVPIYELYRQNYRVEKDPDELAKTVVDNSTQRVQFFWATAAFFPLSANPIYYDKLYRCKLADKQTLDDARDKLTNAQNYSKSVRLESVLKVGFEVGHNLLKHFWATTHNTTQIVEDHYKRFFKGHYVIGLQIRSLFMSVDRIFEELDVFTNCSEMIERTLGANKSVRWFLATDSSWMMRNLAERFPNKIILSKMPQLQWTVEVGDQHVLVDNELLSRCDEMVVTGGSSFGFLAAIRSGKLPFYVNGRNNATECKRVQLHSPPFKTDGQLRDASF